MVLLVFLPGRGQDSISQQERPSKLILRHWVDEDGVSLRWGVSDKILWKSGIENGYIVERHTLERDGVPILDSEVEVLTGEPIKPIPLLEWETLVQSNDMAAVAAQAIYGDSFTVNRDGKDHLMRVVNESSELDQRFAFSMFAVDQDFEVAQYAGMGFRDTKVKKNEKYLYNLRLAQEPEGFSNGSTIALVDPTVLGALPKPYDFAAYYYNNAFVLIWEYDALLEYYASYDLERSTDGINFKRVNNAPITKLAVTKVSGISFTDSIPEYGEKYWYRIRGKNLFNRIGPVSDTVSVKAFKELLVGPEITESEIISDKKAIIRWTFPDDESWKLTGFEVLRSDRAIGPFTELSEPLEKTTKSFEYNDLKPINYFKIRAFGRAGDYQDSSPVMIQPVDSIPPEKPTGLTGTIDTTGVVHLNWNPNSEQDLKGYTVLRSNSPKQEFTRLTKKEWKGTEFQDSVNLKTFNRFVFYRIMASDLRYNESLPSDTLRLSLPSKIPPTSPVFKEYEQLGDTIHLVWTPSSSAGLTKQVIYRKIANTGQKSWESIFETTDVSLNEFKDVNTQPNTKYQYTLVSTGQNGLESNPSPALSIITPKKLQQPQIKALYAQVDREQKSIRLSWKHKQPGVLEFQLFKKTEEGSFTLFKTLPSEIDQFLDQNLIPNTRYSYGMKAIFKNGATSAWNEIDVNY
ncbi:hypothetical protein D2V05_18360 [Flagellimonas pelagia]|uniref:Fibronectin type-III domain-containing protein n=1 Tax=Flagellimonas pelagia TaxID=2306998 RepID=A0A3A1NGH0_9FLAO|nr:hypothetical protein D2V05_18360 [Allomuricauda maritima]